MRSVVVEAPEPIVSIAEVRQQIVELPAEDEAYVMSLIQAATQWIDGPGGWLGRAIGPQVLEWIGWWGCDRIALPYPPIIGEVSIKTEDAVGVVADVVQGADTYRYSRGEILVAAGAAWARQPVHRIQYRAGYETVPQPIKTAILMLVAHWYRSREAVTIGAAVQTIPFGVEHLLSPYRVYSF